MVYINLGKRSTDLPIRARARMVESGTDPAVAQDCWYSSGFPVRTETGKAQGLIINAHYLFDTFRA